MDRSETLLIEKLYYAFMERFNNLLANISNESFLLILRVEVTRIKLLKDTETYLIIDTTINFLIMSKPTVKFAQIT